jgi:pimeloyl-ACP methyl ester carboxylesterase
VAGHGTGDGHGFGEDPVPRVPEDAQRWRDAAASFVQEAPNRNLVTTKGTSHEVPTDRPDLVLKEIEDMFAARH